MARFFKPQKKKSIDTKHKALDVERLDHHGDGVAFDNRKPVFIAGALPGESVVVQLTEDKKSYARAKLIKITSRSEHRVEPFCPHYSVCGGCNLQHLEHDSQIVAKQETLTQLMGKFASAGLEQSAPQVSEAKGYRRSARLAVKVDKQGVLEMGFRQRSSKAIVTVTDCPVLSASLNTHLPAIYACLESLKGRRIIGHIELVDADNGAVLMVRAVKDLHKDDISSLDALAAGLGLTLYLQQADQPAERRSGGRPSYGIEGKTLSFEPADFIQVNADINRKMVEQAVEWLALDDNDDVLDLFCGLGNFSLPMAAKAQSVTGIEGVETMVERAAGNAKDNGLANTDFFHANLEQECQATTWGKRRYSKILLDPARAGAAGVMPFVAQSGARRVVYVSCNPATLARDSQALLAKGYTLARLGMLDMFPHTGHLESMALFVKD